jgi:hypothetical protein
MEQPKIQKTFGEFVANGILELVADEMHSDALKLLLWKEERSRVQQRFSLDLELKSGSATEVRTITFEPEQLDPTFRGAIRFPSHVAPFGSSRKLQEDVCGVIKRFTGLENDHVLLTAHAARASWFPEATDCPTALVICGAHSPRRQRLFQVLSCLCRRPLLLSEINLSSLCSLPWGFSPSLFIEHCPSNLHLQKAIRATRASGYVPWKGKLVRPRCVMVICSEESLAIPEWNAIEIPVTCTSVSLPILNEDAQRKVAREFQAKFLQYRLTNYAKIIKSKFDGAALTSSVSELARSLAMCVVDDPATQADIIRLLKEKDEEVKDEMSSDPLLAVVQALFAICHKEKKISVYAAEVAEAAGPILEQRGELLVSPRTVGNQLRNLGVIPQRLDSKGRGLVLNAKVRKQIHYLARDYKILPDDNGDPGCNDCIEVRNARETE